MDESLIFEDLNPAQRSAVTSPASVLQILAPPGSGKTKTLTARVAYLLSHRNYKPWNTLCLTFTIKSAKEMKERICRLIGNQLGSKLVLGTFHSVCRRYLVTYGYLIGIRKGFGIADSSDSLAIITRITKRLKLNIDPKVARSRISSSKARGISYTDLRAQAANKKNVDQQEFITVFESYEAHLETSNLLDYDDLLLRCLDLLRQHPTCVSNVEVVLIDEFQDTNLVQFDLMRLFAAKCNRITTVGDPDQSIYGWRSAEIKNLKKMQDQYPDTLVIHLEDNYRSSGAILLAALEIIQQDESRPAKPLLPTHCPGTTPVLRRLPSAAIEASWIVTEVQRTMALTGNLLGFADFAILLRSASLSRQIESTMGKAGIPYRMIGGQKFYDRIEIKILLDYLRVVSQPDNSDALARIVNVPSRRIGDVTVRALLEEAAAKGWTLWHLIQDVVRGQSKTSTKISKAAGQALAAVTNIILTARKKMLNTSAPCFPHQLLQHIIQALDFKQYVEKTRPEDHEGRWANVEELMAQASDSPTTLVDPSSMDSKDAEDTLPNIEGLEQASGHPAEEALAKFLANVALSTEVQREEESEGGNAPQGRVTISTIHAAKGLEWPVVFIPSAYDGSIPHSRAEDTDEERRLLYVAMTRAQALLYISCPTRNSQREETTLSSFLSTKKLAPYLTDQGPSLRFTTTSDISRILRRECPLEAVLLKGMSNVENLEDILWPLNGEEDPESVAARWADSERRHGFGARDIAAKRRKVVTTDVVNGTAQVSSSGHDFAATKVSYFPTTMDKVTSTSLSSQARGFISAAVQMQHMQAVLPAEKQMDTVKATKLGAITSGLNTKSDTTNCSGLMRYWGSSEAEKQSETLSSHAASLTVEVITKKKSADALTISQKASSGITLAGCNAGSAQRRPMSIIPQPLSNHPFPPYAATRSLRADLPDKGSNTKPYVFLSSSPPPMMDIARDEQATAVSATDSITPSYTAEREQKAAEVPADIRPCLTHHVTSQAKVQARNQAPRRTLGVRRSMTGWSARGNHSLSKPRIID